MNTTVNGVAENEDVDYFEINATKGQRISVEVEAIRLSGPLFDPYVAILTRTVLNLRLLMIQNFFCKIQQQALLPQKQANILLKCEILISWEQIILLSFAYWFLPSPTCCFSGRRSIWKTQEFTFLGDPSGPIKINHSS